ncbi:hypothetical protein [Cellulomonas fengjieae]|uniref:MFS transporter n=1 Tax=Cellulomonas fengjieae TaxID=2819978 RepID=A0ABS3SK65_9CELL|nr:hypothetical protein [Cellulomonas fengjieae]MBO3086141.1 hypothetical protein [Cellulomonas fengjieae]MBO3102455.1 hypothetical protein [Cellulomonas fengjieae]QVI65797.1 hypothetical protein KG102_17260 [Cellulomonas fengjieae]
MPLPATGPLRLARAAVVAAVTVALAALAHVLAGGSLPPFVVVVSLAAVVLAAAVVLTGRRVGPVGAVALLGVGQLAVHSVFSLVTSMACLPAATLAGHQHHPGMAMPSQAACAADPALAQPVLGVSAMLLLHAVATLVVALVVVGTDRALWWLAAWLRPLVGGPAPVVVVPRPSLPAPAEVPGPVTTRWRDVVPLRGPPAWRSPVLPPR